MNLIGLAAGWDEGFPCMDQRGGEACEQLGQRQQEAGQHVAAIERLRFVEGRGGGVGRGVDFHLPLGRVESRSTDSTVIALNEPSTASRRRPRSRGPGTSASSVIWASVVAISGRTMPAPFAMPPMRTSGRTADPVVRAERMRAIPMRRPGEVDEVANAILFLASDEASYITGSEVHVDGGALAI